MNSGEDPPIQTDGDATKICPNCGVEYPAGTRFCPADGGVLRLKSQTDSLIGEVIGERYHVLKRIGQGGMGTVYLAEHVRMGRRCAVKVMNRALSADPVAVGRFAREAANASRISNDHVAHIYDFGETTEHGIYLAMEYLEGETLSVIMAREAPFAPERAVAIALQITDALMAAHREGVVHRDLTPNNIVVGRSHHGGDIIKVVDFGIAKTLQDAGSTLTKTGLVVGTPQYMSPEQLIAEPVDGRSDIYQLGCIMFEMLVGAQPFAGPAGGHDFTRRLTQDAPRPASMNPRISAALDDAVITSLARNPAHRFQSAADFQAALHAIQGATGTAESAQTPPPGRTEIEPRNRSETDISTAPQTGGLGARNVPPGVTTAPVRVHATPVGDPRKLRQRALYAVVTLAIIASAAAVIRAVRSDSEGASGDLTATDSAGLRNAAADSVDSEVQPTANSLRVVRTPTDMRIGDRFTFSALRSDGTGLSTTNWRSSDPTVLSIERTTGMAKALKAGTARVTISDSSGDSASIAIDVRPAPAQLRTNAPTVAENTQETPNRVESRDTSSARPNANPPAEPPSASRLTAIATQLITDFCAKLSGRDVATVRPLLPPPGAPSAELAASFLEWWSEYRPSAELVAGTLTVRPSANGQADLSFQARLGWRNFAGRNAERNVDFVALLEPAAGSYRVRNISPVARFW